MIDKRTKHIQHPPVFRYGYITLVEHANKQPKEKYLVRNLSNRALGIVEGCAADYYTIRHFQEHSDFTTNVRGSELCVVMPILVTNADRYDLTYASYPLLLTIPENEYIYSYKGRSVRFKNKVKEGDSIKITSFTIPEFGNTGTVKQKVESAFTKSNMLRNPDFYLVTLDSGVKIILNRMEFVLTSKNDIYETVNLICPQCNAL